MRRYALVGTGSRAEMYVTALTTTYAETNCLVGLCDPNPTRMAWHNRHLQEAGLEPVPTYSAERFREMICETQADAVVVTTVDALHHRYIAEAMRLGCDVITEKPLTTDEERIRFIFDAVEETGKSLRVTFNYRHAPAFAKVRELIQGGAIGRPLSVDFSWLLDTSHGADYFRRWHREKRYSGGLLVHKASHHFDLVNWWLDAYPEEVFAMGNLLFYGRENAEARGEHYSYARYTGEPEAREDPFALHLDQDPDLQGLYLAAEGDDGYLRDRNVFGEPITIEDTMAVTARYRGGALLSYSLVAYSPWEGMRAAITGTGGRVELEVVESSNRTAKAGVAASKGPHKGVRLRRHPMFEDPHDLEVPLREGGHGGADPSLLKQLFSDDPPPDPLSTAATHLDGAASALLGIAANRSITTGMPVRIDDLFPLKKD